MAELLIEKIKSTFAPMSANKAITALILGTLLCFFAACKPDKATLLSKKWKTTAINNTSLNKEKEYYLHMLDTITENNEMIEFFGTIDSFKKFIKADLAQQEEIQRTNLENSFMEFRKNNVAYFTSVDGIDSSKWRLEENEIILEDEDFTGVPGLVRFSIDKLSEKELIITMINQYDTSTITLIPAKN